MTPVYASEPTVAIVIVNWNGWQDTVECLESVLRLTHRNFRVVVCDNGSSDGSLERIKAWAEGLLPAPAAANPALQPLTIPPVPKPVPLMLLSRAEAEEGGGELHRLVLIDSGENLGFAGGNNVALRYLLKQGDFSFAWLLNNDTVVTPGALTALLQRMAEDHAVGLCGSSLCYYQEPTLVQGLGGARYNRWLGTNSHLGVLRPLDGAVSRSRVEQAMDYVIGASMLVTRRFVDEIGLMNEDYFLYYEELDWALRAKGRFSLAWAPDSIVYHKEGQSAGTSYDPKRKSGQVDYYVTRNKLMLTRRYHPFALPTVCLGIICACCNRVRRGQWRRIGVIWQAVRDALSGRTRQAQVRS